MLAIISSRYQYGPFLFFVAEVMSNYLTTDGLKNFFLLPEAPLWHEARGICHICHMVNPALLQCFEAVGWAAGRASGLQKTEWWGAGWSGARCRLAYGPADATSTHCLLLQ